MRYERGFLLVELLVSIAIVMAVLGMVFQLADPAEGLFDAELERNDAHQRARVTADGMMRDLLMAGAGRAPAVAPYRRGEVDPDPPGSVFTDRFSVLYLDAELRPVNATYWTRVDGSGVSYVMRYDGSRSDLPVADHVAIAGVDYLDAAAQPISAGRLSDGPWVPDAVTPDRFDADLTAVRRVAVRLSVRAARIFLRSRVPDQTVRVEVAPRNLNLQ